MKKIKRKALIFFLVIISYFLVTIVFHLYENSLIFVSYFFIPIIWVLLFSRSPMLWSINNFIPALMLYTISNWVNKKFGKEILPWTEGPTFTRLSPKDLMNSLILILVLHMLIAFVLISVTPPNSLFDIVNPSVHLFVIFLDLIFWLVIFIGRLVFQTLYNDWS